MMREKQKWFIHATEVIGPDHPEYAFFTNHEECADVVVMASNHDEAAMEAKKVESWFEPGA
ncbi:MAG: hypothetical protein HY565_00685 [Candidatus Kerfeldbacteria bacterium]|nr:hypothetical protein [Candidatus Kerfeldbacteria bacterium]